MNPSSAPPPNHFPFPYPPPPNPNPSPNIFFHPLHRPPSPYQPPPPPYQLPPPPPPPQQQFAAASPVPDVSTALSSLTELLSLSRRTLGSLSSLIDSKASPEKLSGTFVPCSYNPHHLMPPESLFLHSLRCPSPVCEDPTSLVQALYYPKTLNLQYHTKTQFDESSEGREKGERCLSLDSYYREFRSNFFYQDCPGAVSFCELENSGKMVTLPSVLSLECGDCVGARGGEPDTFDGKKFRILPSELWTITREVEGWVDYPMQYSYGVLCAVLRLNVVKKKDIGHWIIASSPRFGCVIDAYMRDHISVLFGLCLNAIRREAMALVGCDVSVGKLSFPCPVSVQALKWLASQLSVLYGEVNAKCFTVYIFKQWTLEAAKKALLFCSSPDFEESSKDLDKNKSDTRDEKLEGPFEGCKEHEEGKKAEENAEADGIVVSQVAAAVAALKERSLLEAKIKALKKSQLLPSYQRAVEHAHLSTRADEERRKHPNYRATIEHDGFPRRSTNQESSRPKTKEELLAEERDYKRRRMSYRGKKLKRTTLQVMRDIIDECMEEIKQAGGIGCFEKGDEQESFPTEPLHDIEVSMDISRGVKINDESSKATTITTDHQQRQSYSRHDKTSASSQDSFYKNIERQGQDHHYYRTEPRNNGSDGRRVREYYSKSPERQRSHGQAHERDRRAVELTGFKHPISSSKSNSRYDKSSFDVWDSGHGPHVHKKHKVSDKRDRHPRNSSSRHSSSREAYGFEDRYDPPKSP